MTTSAAPDPLDEPVAAARARFADRRPRTAALHRDAEGVLPGGNTRTVLYHEPFPVRIERAERARLVDCDGIEYVDLLGDFSAGLFGHSDPTIAAAIDRARAEGLSFGAHGRGEVELARLVCARFPSIESVRFTNSGTEANLLAVSAARALTKRRRLVVFDGAYHGGVLSFGPRPSPLNVPFDFLVLPYNDLAAATAAFAETGDDIAAVLVEPMLGSGGCIPGAPEFIAGLRTLCDDHGALLIADEVMTSRFGPGGMMAELGVAADLVTLGKYLGGGLSFGACGGRIDLMAAFDPARPDALAHAGTFNNNTLSMAAGAAGLGSVYTPAVAVAHDRRGEDLRRSMNEACSRSGLGVHVSGHGSLMNIHPCAGPLTFPADLVAADDRRRELIFHDLLDAGFWLARRGYVALSLALDDADLERFVEAFATVLDERAALLG